MAGSLKEVRERIKSVKSTQQITKAMKMVSAAKLRKAQQAITDMRPYADRLSTMLVNILSNTDGDTGSDFSKVRDAERIGIVVVTSSKGLCGAFNSNIVKATAARVREKYGEALADGRVRIICIGKKGYEGVRRLLPEAVLDDSHVDLSSSLTFPQVEKVAQELMDHFTNQELDIIEVAYGRFKNAATQIPEVEQFLPVRTDEPKDDHARSDYIFEPDQHVLLEHLIPSILKTTFFKYLLDTHASEHGARMTAMDKASENAEELLKDLRITYNKARQEAITRELSEIVGGAAALEGA